MLGVESKKKPADRELRALIAEDDPTGRKLVEMVLWKMNFRDVEAVGDGMEAWKAIIAADSPFDIIIADWHMPFATGIELLEQVRGAGMNVPFLMLTSNDTMNSVIKAQENDVTAYMTKPCTPQRLMRKISEVLSLTVVI